MNKNSLKQLRKSKSKNPKLKLKKKPSQKWLIGFSRNLAIMLKAKLPLTNSLQNSISQSKDASTILVLTTIQKKVERGNSLANALKSFPDLFNEMYIQIVDMGERTGILGDVLLRHTSYMDKAYRLKKKFMMSLIYPLIILVVAFLATSFMLLFVIPSFSEIYLDLSGSLPKATLILLWFSGNYFNLLLLLVTLLSVTFGVIKYTASLKKIKEFYHRKLLNIPIVGNLFSQNYSASIFRMLGEQLSSGIALAEALATTEKAIDNSYVKKQLKAIRKDVKKGIDFSQACKKMSIFSDLSSQLIKIAEESGTLDENLLNLADVLEEEHEQSLDVMLNLLEPVLIIFFGLTVTVLLLALYLPMFELSSIVG